MITVLGLDPGTNNCAYGVVQATLNPFRYRILAHGMIQNTVKEMNGFEVGYKMKKFAAEIRKLRRKYKCDFAIAERYMTRGHGGTTIEAISSQLGLVGSVFGTEVCFISAAVWKNAWNKHQDLKDFYNVVGKKYGLPPHRVDAVSIGLYGTTLLLEAPHFAFLTNLKQFEKRLIQHI